MEDDSREHAPTEHQLATTKVRGTSNAITQSEFVSIICRPGAGAYALSELFDFRRPKTGQRSKTSKILQLDEKQLDAMYALSGCSDVLSVMSSVNKPARDAMWNVYGIDKHGFSTWFKNRRLVPKERMTSPGSAKKQRNHLSLPASDLKQHSSARSSPHQSFTHLGSDLMLDGLINRCPSLPILPMRQQYSGNLGNVPGLFNLPSRLSAPMSTAMADPSSSDMRNSSTLLDVASADAIKDAARQQSLLRKEISHICDFQDNDCDKELEGLLMQVQDGLLNIPSPTGKDPIVPEMDEFDLLLANNNRAWLDNV